MFATSATQKGSGAGQSLEHSGDAWGDWGVLGVPAPAPARDAEPPDAWGLPLTSSPRPTPGYRPFTPGPIMLDRPVAAGFTLCELHRRRLLPTAARQATAGVPSCSPPIRVSRYPHLLLRDRLRSSGSAGLRPQPGGAPLLPLLRPPPLQGLRRRGQLADARSGVAASPPVCDGPFTGKGYSAGDHR